MRKNEGDMAQAKKHPRHKQSGEAREENPAFPTSGSQSLEHLPYGHGQREQYGEGYKYRHEDLSQPADVSNSSDWAGGDHTGVETGIPETAPIKRK
jgi:hypothetical protein